MLTIALLIDVLKQLLPGKLLAGPDDLRDAPVSNAQRLLFAAFTDEAETYLVSLDRRVPVLQRGQAIAVVVPGVIVIPYADQRGLQEMHDGCQNFFRGRPRNAICSRTVSRMEDSASANATTCSYFVLSRTSRKCAW